MSDPNPGSNADWTTDWLTVAEVSTLLLRTRQWVYQRVRDGTFRALQRGPGKPLAVSAYDVTTWMLDEMKALEARITYYQDHIPLPSENQDE